MISLMSFEMHQKKYTHKEREREQRITNCNGMILEGTKIRQKKFF